MYAAFGGFDPKNIDPLGQKDSEAWDVGDGLARIRGEIRTSFIIDIPDGRLPFSADAIKRFHFDDPSWQRGYDNPEARTVTERCVASEGGYPPQLNSPDGNFMQIVQTADHVAMLIEKYHDVHIVRMGDAIGRWEGETLVIENSNFCAAGLSRHGRLKLSMEATVVERFTRTNPNDLLYEFKVTDPTIYTQPWRAEMPFKTSKGPICEYTRHEGNYGLTNMLAGDQRLEGKTIDGVAKGN